MARGRGRPRPASGHSRRGHIDADVAPPARYVLVDVKWGPYSHLHGQRSGRGCSSHDPRTATRPDQRTHCPHHREQSGPGMVRKASQGRTGEAPRGQTSPPCRPRDAVLADQSRSVRVTTKRINGSPSLRHADLVHSRCNRTSLRHISLEPFDQRIRRKSASAVAFVSGPGEHVGRRSEPLLALHRGVPLRAGSVRVRLRPGLGVLARVVGVGGGTARSA